MTRFLTLLFVAAASLSAETGLAADAPGSLELPLSSGVFTTGNSFAPITSWRLNQFKKTIDKNSEAVSLDSVTREPSDSEVMLGFDSSDFLYLLKAKGSLSNQGGTAVWTYEDDK